MERRKVGTKENEVPRAYNNHIKIHNNKHNMEIFYKIWKKYDEIQLTKNKTDLHNRKIKKNHPPSPPNHGP